MRACEWWGLTGNRDGSEGCGGTWGTGQGRGSVSLSIFWLAFCPLLTLRLSGIHHCRARWPLRMWLCISPGRSGVSLIWPRGACTAMLCWRTLHSLAHWVSHTFPHQTDHLCLFSMGSSVHPKAHGVCMPFPASLWAALLAALTPVAPQAPGVGLGGQMFIVCPTNPSPASFWQCDFAAALAALCSEFCLPPPEEIL